MARLNSGQQQNVIISYLVCIEPDFEEIIQKSPESGEGCNAREKHNISKLDVQLQIIIVSFVNVLRTLPNILISVKYVYNIVNFGGGVG